MEQWWEGVKADNQSIDELVIYADSGLESSSRRTWFLLRMVGFARKTGLANIEPYILRNPELKKWDVIFVPELVSF